MYKYTTNVHAGAHAGSRSHTIYCTDNGYYQEGDLPQSRFLRSFLLKENCFIIVACSSKGVIWMYRRLDRTMYEISVIYIALPVFLFLAGWLRLIIAIPVCVIFLVSLFFLLKNRPEPTVWHIPLKKCHILLAAFLLLAVWVFFSGQGGFSFQNSDYHSRNAIFHDLIEKSWPVVYDYKAQSAQNSAGIMSASDTAVLTYYIAFWLPGALVGKIFGWYAANAFLYFWTLLGVVLITYFLFRTLRNAGIWSVLVLIFFSGLDILGYILLSQGKLPGMTAHIEWWSGMQYSSNTTLLFWVFNQTVTIWLAILLILNMKNSRSLFFLYAMLLLHGPFPFVGMLPIVLWKAYQGHSLIQKEPDSPEGKRKHVILVFVEWFWGGIRRALTFENVAGGISVLLIIFLYLKNNISSAASGTNGLFSNYYLFIVFEAGLYLMTLCVDHYRKPLFWISLGSLLVIPFFRIGASQDFCMRVSIPALFVVQLLIQQTLFGKEEFAPVEELCNEEANEEQAEALVEELDKALVEVHADARVPEIHRSPDPASDKRLLRVILASFLVIGSVVPLQEISRSVIYTLPSYRVTKSAMISVGTALQNSGNTTLEAAGESILTQSQYGITWSDSFKTLGNDKDNSLNFIGSTQNNFFYEYLARQ